MTAKNVILKFREENSISDVTAKNLESLLINALKKEKLKEVSWPVAFEYLKLVSSVNDNDAPYVKLGI